MHIIVQRIFKGIHGLKEFSGLIIFVLRHHAFIRDCAHFAIRFFEGDFLV